MIKSNFVTYLIISFVFFNLFFTLFYIIDSVNLLFSVDNSLLFLFFNLLVLFFEVLTAIYGIFLFFHIAYLFIPDDTHKLKVTDDLNPLVTIVIPTYNPDLYAVETNLLNLQNLTYKNVEIIISDNSDDPIIINEINSLCSKFKAKMIHRSEILGFKAKNINNALSEINGKYFFIIDIDQSIKPDAIKKMIHTFENSRDDLAFIQGRFEIENANTVIRNSIAILYTFFFYVISLAKSKRGTVLFSGSSACFKTRIVKEIGGFPLSSYTEDISISYHLFLQGYSSQYLNIVVTTALVSWRLQDLLTSFWRWSYGGTSVIRLYGLKILKSNKLSISKKIELLLNGISFIAFSGILIVTSTIALMNFVNIEISRSTLGPIPLILIVPTIISLSLLLSCIIGLYESKTLYRLPYLVPYAIASIAISFFILIPTFYSLIGIQDVDSKNSKWNRDFHLKKVLFVLTLLLVIFLFIFQEFFRDNNLLWMTYAIICISIILTIIFLIKDKWINVEKESYVYFSNFRAKNGLQMESKYKYQGLET